jgi:hypothetical protein
MNYEMVSVELGTLKDMVPRLRREIRNYAVSESQFMRELEKKLPHCRGIGEIRMQMTIDQIDRLRDHKKVALDQLAQLSAKITELEYRKERNSYEAGEVQWNLRLTELAKQYCSFSPSESIGNLRGSEFQSHPFSSKAFNEYGVIGGRSNSNGPQRYSINKGALVNIGAYQATNSGDFSSEMSIGNNSAAKNFTQLMLQSREIAENRIRAEKIRQAVPSIGKTLLVEKDRIIFGDEESRIDARGQNHLNFDHDSKASESGMGKKKGGEVPTRKIGKKVIAISIVVPLVVGTIIAFELQTSVFRKIIGSLLTG